MSSASSPAPTDASADSSAVAERGSLRLARGVTATWWYTVTALLMFEAVVVLATIAVVASSASTPPAVGFSIGLGGLVWVGSTVILLTAYRHRTDAAHLVRWRKQLPPLILAVTYSIIVGALSGLWIVAALPLLQSLMLLNWQSGVRARAMFAATALLIGLAVIDTHTTSIGASPNWWPLVAFSVILPSMTVVSLWWWDVLARLDRARASESRLAATQERLRVATDVHDLQGHHLQVVALQLELAERLMTKDPDAALEQLRLARASVAEAQQGTRDLALRFRSVPLRDEIANAVDLLRAAGTAAAANVDADADRAPASVLGPVIRETTTNVLRHGGGKWARLSLVRQGESWRYEISNDAAADTSASGDGSGLDGISRRAAEIGGSVDVRRNRNEFTVVVTVPVDVPVDMPGEQR